MEDEEVCVDCGMDTDLICEVCSRRVCEKCVKANHEKNNLHNSEPNKVICEYCADIYWRGF